MTAKWLPLTYAPKIDGVMNGTIRQTIRPDWKYKVGDRIGFHTWSGRPYASPWGRRLELHPLTLAWDVFLDKREVSSRDYIKIEVDGDDGHVEFSGPSTAIPWEMADDLARLDGITPATGEALKTVLEGFHGPFGANPVKFQVLRW